MNDKDKNVIFRRMQNGLVGKILQRSPKVKPVDFNLFFSKFFNFVMSPDYDPHVCHEQIIFAVVDRIQGASSRNILSDPKSFCSSIRQVIKTQNIFFINYQGFDVTEVADETYCLDIHSNLAEISSIVASPCFALRGRALTVVAADGTLCTMLDNIANYERSAMVNAQSQPISHYKQIISRFELEHVRKEKRINYWKPGRDKPYVLANAPEEAFKKALFSYINDHAIAQVYSEMRLDGGRDTVDIFAKSPEGITYLFEVKWLGVSEKSNGNRIIYGELRANVALRQTHIYVTDSSNPEDSMGIPVLFDGREVKDPISYYPKVRNSCHRNVQEPVLIELQDTTASKEADKFASETKKSAKS